MGNIQTIIAKLSDFETGIATINEKKVYFDVRKYLNYVKLTMNSKFENDNQKN